MKIEELLTDLAERGVQIQAENDQLIIRAPKHALTPEVRAELARYKSDILALLKRRQMNMQEELPFPFVPDLKARYEPFPLTDMQQAYWLGRSGAFELGQVACQSYVELEAKLDVERLNVAWQRLIEHHDMLRMVILPDGQQQILAQVPPYQIETLDLRNQNHQQVTRQLEDIRNEMSHRISKVNEWPLFELRTTLLDNGRVRLHLRIDLLIADAWSIILLLKQWSQLYQDPTSSLPSLELSFRDYVLAEQAIHETERYRHARDYWFARLETLPPAPELPLIQNPNAIQQVQFVRRSTLIEADVWSRFKDQASRHGLTPSGALCAAFSEVLATWCKARCFTLNLTFFNRMPVHPQIAEIVGDFASTILLEVNHTRHSFVERAQQLQEQLATDLEYSSFSGVRVLRELNRVRGGNMAAAMPVVFTSILASRDGSEQPQVAPLGEIIYGVSQTPQLWLDHQVAEQNGALSITWDAVEALFPQGLLDDMFAAFCNLVRRLAIEDTIWQETALQLIPEQQLKQRKEVNTTDAPISSELLHTLFMAQVPQREHQQAVVSSQKTLTYQELAHRAQQAGHWLRQRGVKPGQLIGIVMEKGWEQVVAVLGVLLSGAAYLPIDADLPGERLLYLLQDGEVELVLTQSWIDAKVDWPTHVQRFCVDSASDEESGPLPLLQTPEDLAYVIYTSGSTGRPKGVMIDHRGAVNTIIDINQRFAVTSNDRVLALSSLSFDLSVYDIFGTLAAGGTIVIPDPQLARDPAHWAELLRSEHITLWNSVPALLEMLAGHIESRSDVLPSSLRLALLSGDWIPITLPTQLKALSESLRVISLGGATEASIWSICYPIENVDPSWKSIPYGRPLANQRFYVLNEAYEPCPIWVPGQLYIGGIGLAKGYWHDLEKTHARFISHPHTGERLYDTGDLGRYLPDGSIEFLGREDFQVKIRGHRIELGEIEATLAEHPAVQSTIVDAVGTQQSHRRLVAYFVPAQDPVPSQQDLRTFLQTRLPEYMIPATFISLPTFPLTANGKVDRRALPAPEWVQVEQEDSYVAPRSPVEETIADIWARILGVERVGIYDNLFELGGDSLRAVQIVNAVQQTYQVELSMVNLFEQPNVARLALCVEELIIDQILAETSKNGVVAGE